LIVYKELKTVIKQNFALNSNIDGVVLLFQIIECLLSLRADVYHRIGIYDRSSVTTLKYSPYVTCSW